MIAMMSVSFFLIGLVGLMVVMFFVGIGVLVAAVTKRPGIVAMVGLAIFLLFGVGFALLIGVRSVSHANVHSGTYNTFAEVHDDPTIVHHDPTIVHPQMFDGAPMPNIGDGTTHMHQIMDGSGEAWSGMPTISTPVESSSRTHYRADFTVWIFLLPIAAIVALIVAAVSRLKSGSSSSSASRRGSWWPALLLIPVFAVLALSFLGFFGLRVTREFGGVPQMETLHHNLAMQQAAQQRAYAEATRAEELAKSQIRLRIAKDQRQNDMAKAKQLQESQRIAAAMNVQLQRHFATMDINQLIAIFESPKIKLSSTAEAPAAPEPPVAVATPVIPAAPAVTVPIVTVAEEKPNEVVEVAKPQDKPAEVADDQTKQASEKKKDQPQTDDNAAVIAATELPTPIEKTEPLPDWVDDQPGMVGDDWREVVATDEYATAEEARRATDVCLMLKTAERIQTLAGRYVDHSRPSITFHRDTVLADGNVILVRGEPVISGDHRLYLLRKMGIGIDEIRRSVVREEHLASRDSRRAFDTMYKNYTLAQFTPWFDGQLRKHWDAYLRQERFAMVGVGAGSVLGLLGFVFGLLKIDTWTKGYYTKRLFLGVPAAIIGGFALIAFLSEIN